MFLRQAGEAIASHALQIGLQLDVAAGDAVERVLPERTAL